MTDLTLYLLRHGESIANVERMFAARKIDPPLSELGVRQVTIQAESLKSTEFSAMYASPLVRARQTATIVGQQCELEVLVSDALQEVDVGILDGERQDDPQKWAVYENVIRKWEQGSADMAFPGGETLNDVEDRFRGFLDRLEGNQRKPVLTVGHCLFFMAVIWLFCDNRGPTLKDGHMGRGCLSIIRRMGDRFHLLKFNIPPDTSAQDIWPVI